MRENRHGAAARSVLPSGSHTKPSRPDPDENPQAAHDGGINAEGRVEPQQLEHEVKRAFLGPDFERQRRR